MIADTDKDSLGDILTADGYTPVAETKNFQRFSHSDPDRIDIDVLFVDPPTFEKLTTDSSPLAGSPSLSIPSILHFTLT